MLIGPLVGGLLSAQNAENGLIRGYPYAAPNIVCALVYALAATGVFFGLEETLETLQHTEGSFSKRLWKKIKSRWTPEEQSYTAINSEDSPPQTPIIELSPASPSAPEFPPTNEPPKRKLKLPFRRIWTRNVLCTMLAHFIIAGHLGTFSNLWAIFLSTPPEKYAFQHPPFRFGGGLGMLPREVGVAMSILGAVGVTLQLVVYPMLNDRFGTVKIWQGALFVFPIVYALAPFPALVASANENGGKTMFVWIAMLFVLLLFVIGRTGGRSTQETHPHFPNP
jgi:hypothetical protein